MIIAKGLGYFILKKMRYVFKVLMSLDYMTIILTHESLNY